MICVTLNVKIKYLAQSENNDSIFTSKALQGALLVPMGRENNNNFIIQETNWRGNLKHGYVQQWIAGNKIWGKM